MQNHLEIKNELLLAQKVEQFDRIWCKKIYFSKWIDKLEDKNEIKSMHLVFKARKHYETTLLRNGVDAWIYFIREQRVLNVKIKIRNKVYDDYYLKIFILLKEKLKKADDFRNKNLLKFYFAVIREYVEITKYKRDNYNLADEIYK